jgi:hypothetical protein
MTKKNKLLKTTHYGELTLGNSQISCYVLEDGRRVLSGRGMQSALNLGKTRGQKIPQLVEVKQIKPFVSKELELGIFSPIEFETSGGFRAFGYEATTLVDLCDLLLESRKYGVLPEKYILVADQAETLTRAFAKVGIIALVDEATGYQYDRERDELQKILKAYISEELLSWQKRFPDIYYKELFRLNGWEFTVHGIKKRPGVIGKWTNTLVYERLPKGVLEELKTITPKNESGKYLAKLHQHLTLDIGEPNLSAQLNKVITIFQLSDNMEQVWSNFKKVKDREEGQLEIPFQLDEKGHTKEPIYEEQELSDFNKKLKKALNYKLQ